jgi:hypothetical protein
LARPIKNDLVIQYKTKKELMGAFIVFSINAACLFGFRFRCQMVHPGSWGGKPKEVTSEGILKIVTAAMGLAGAEPSRVMT